MKIYNNHVLILGSARSGSSWFSELLAQRFRYRMLFEPEHEFNTSEGKLIADQYMTEESYNADAKRYLRKVFANRIDSDWIGQNSNRKWKRHLWPFVPKKYIIKMVRGNLAGRFMYSHFRMPTIYLVRNPYDTILSQNRVKFPWLYSLDHFRNNEEVTRLLKEEYNFSFDQKEFNDLEKLAVRWCIENCELFQINEMEKVPFLKVKYEDLIKNVALFRQVCEIFNLQPIDTLEDNYRNPSSKTHPKSKIHNKSICQPIFSKEELQVINVILDQFQIDFYMRRYE